MASTVYTTEEIQLRNGTTVKLKPLSIKDLREFMKIMGQTETAKTEDETLDILMEACGLALAGQVENIREDKDLRSDVLDVPTINRIIKICSGIDLEDPNLLAAAQALTAGLN